MLGVFFQVSWYDAMHVIVINGKTLVLLFVRFAVHELSVIKTSNFSHKIDC